MMIDDKNWDWGDVVDGKKVRVDGKTYPLKYDLGGIPAGFHEALREGFRQGQMVHKNPPKISAEFDSRVGTILIIDGKRFDLRAARQLFAELREVLGAVRDDEW